MTDQLDEAQRLAELQRDDALASHHRRVDQVRATHGRRECIDCGDSIPDKRRLAIPGCQRCVACQADFERGGFA